jgi:hypothetical protein
MGWKPMPADKMWFHLIIRGVGLADVPSARRRCYNGRTAQDLAALYLARRNDM